MRNKAEFSQLTRDEKAKLLDFAPAAGASEAREESGRTRQTPPSINCSMRELRDISRDAIQALEAANDPPNLFVRSGRLVRIRIDERGQHLIEEVGIDALRGMLARCADFYKSGGNGRRVPIAPPDLVLRDILTMSELQVPPLVGLTEVPIVRPDGTIFSAGGYDWISGFYYAAPEGLTIPSIPENPTEQEVRDAVDLINELLEDFPFADAASLATAWAACLTPILRPAIAGPSPLILIDAPAAGTGKTLLADCIARIATGRPGAMMTVPRDDDEMRKRLTAILMAGTTVVILDNVEDRLCLPSLACAITAPTWRDRILGANTEIVIPTQVTWLATGNNIRLGGDLPRRCIWCRLDAKTARPWKRSGFKHEDLAGWVEKNRAHLVRAILILAAAWFAQGRPRPEIPVVGGFQRWATMIGGVLKTAGIGGFLENLDVFYAEADAEAAQWEAFLGGVRDRYRNEPWTVSELAARMKEENAKEENAQERGRLVDLLPENLAESFEKPQSFKRRLGNALARKAEVRFGKLRVVRAGEKQRAVLWAVRTDEEIEKASDVSLVS